MRTYLTIPKALEQYPALTKPDLDRLIETGKITTFILKDVQNSQQIVYDDDIAAHFADINITPEQFDNLRGNLISMSDAAKKYNREPAQISQWVQQGVLKFHGWDRNRKLVDEADVAYMVKIMQAKKVRPGKKIFAKVS